MFNNQQVNRIYHYLNIFYITLTSILLLCNTIILMINYDSIVEPCEQLIKLWIILDDIILIFVIISFVFKIKKMYENSIEIDNYNIVVLFLFLSNIAFGYYVVSELKKM